MERRGLIIALLSLLVLVVLWIAGASAGAAQGIEEAESSAGTPKRSYLYMPITSRARPPAPTPTPVPTQAPVVCDTPESGYGSLWVGGASYNPDAHPDINLALRGYVATNQYRGLVDYNGDTDIQAPQLYGLFADNRTPTFSSVYQVRQWDWSCNCLSGPITSPAVTLAGLATAPGEIIRVPDRSGGDIGNGYKVLVLYATENRITLKYTREDNVVHGYTLHVENVCVDPDLLALYRSLNQAGRGTLPALYGGQSVGRARGNELQVAIRDVGSFMDPRSRKDWWAER